ncbi:MAG: TetR/AcrR family transcriptional regulator [Bacilli bacterium]
MTARESDTKKRILKEALTLIKANGYDAVTINDICKASEVSKHTFYYHFSSKEELLIQFFTIPRDVTADNLSSLLDAPNAVEQFWRLIEPGIDFFEEVGIEITKRIYIANVSRPIGTFSKKDMNRDLVRAEISVLTRAQAAGEILTPLHPQELIWLFKIQKFGVISSWCVSNGQFPLKEMMRSSMERLLLVREDLRKSDELASRMQRLHETWEKQWEQENQGKE